MKLEIRLKKDGIDISFSRVPMKWFVKGDQRIKIIIYVKMQLKGVSLEAADNASKSHEKLVRD